MSLRTIKRAIAKLIGKKSEKKSVYKPRIKTKPRKPLLKKSQKARRNGPCPCGSGLKHKHCHGNPTKIIAVRQAAFEAAQETMKELIEEAKVRKGK